MLLLYLIISGRINFLKLGCYRQQFEHSFDWLSFNSTLAKSHLGARLAIAFDPSYISKSGNVLLIWVIFGPAERAKQNAV